VIESRTHKNTPEEGPPNSTPRNFSTTSLTRSIAASLSSTSSLHRCLAASLLLTLPSCSSSLFSSPLTSPFHKHGDDLGERVSIARLRDISGPSPETFTPKPIQRTSQTPEEAEVLRNRFASMETMALGLEESRASVLANNLDLRVALIDPTIAQERVTQEDARFESAFTLRSGWRENDSPTASQLDANQSRNLFVEPGVRVPMRTGGDITVSLPVAKNESDNTFSTLNPAYTSDLAFSISHPLLRNAGRRANTTALRIASYDRQATEARTKLEAIRQLAAIDRAYWRLYQIRAEFEVTQQQYELASEQLARAQRRVGAGLINDIEVVRAQAGVADRLGAIISAQRNVLIQQRELKRIVNLPGLTLDTPTIITTATPPDPVEYEMDPRGVANFAVANRMEMLELELRLAADAAQIDLARNQSLPLLTLDYTYRVNGLGASTQDSFHTLQRNRFEDWEVGLSAEIPLGNEQAKSRVRAAILSRIQRLSTKAAREQAIRQETLDSIDDLTAGYQSIIAARQSVILNTRALQSEQRAFDTGRSTSTDVLDAAARLAEAQVAEIRALSDYQISQVDLAFATGTVLGAAKVSWEPIDKPGPDTTTWYKQSMPNELSDKVQTDPAQPELK